MSCTCPRCTAQTINKAAHWLASGRTTFAAELLAVLERDLTERQAQPAEVLAPVKLVRRRLAEGRPHLAAHLLAQFERDLTAAIERHRLAAVRAAAPLTRMTPVPERPKGEIAAKAKNLPAQRVRPRPKQIVLPAPRVARPGPSGVVGPRRSRRQSWLAGLLARGMAVEHLAGGIDVRPGDIRDIAAGRVDLAPNAWRRLEQVVAEFNQPLGDVK